MVFLASAGVALYVSSGKIPGRMVTRAVGGGWAVCASICSYQQGKERRKNNSFVNEISVVAFCNFAGGGKVAFRRNVI